MVSLSATNANSEKKWRGFYNSLSISELQEECMSAGIANDIKKGARFWLPPLSSALLYPCEQSISNTNHFADLRNSSARTPTQF